MKHPTTHFADIAPFPMGSHQVMSYYQHWLKRYEGLKRHEKEIDWRESPGYDQEILMFHDEIKTLVDADIAAEYVTETIYAKWMKPALKIAARIKHEHPQAALLFKALNAFGTNKKFKRYGLLGEAIDTFANTTLSYWETDAPVDLTSYRELKTAFEEIGHSIVTGKSISHSLATLNAKYSSFGDDIATAEAENANVFYEDCDHEEEQDLGEIIGNIECSNKDLDGLVEDLHGYTDGHDILIDWHADNQNFHDRIDPDGNAMFYTLMGLQWYHMWARNVGPCELIDLLGRNKMLLESLIDCLAELFPDTKQLCFKASKAIALYTNFVQDAEQFKLDRTATELMRHSKLESIFEALRNVAYAIKEQEESYMVSCTQENNSKAQRPNIER